MKLKVVVILLVSIVAFWLTNLLVATVQLYGLENITLSNCINILASLISNGSFIYFNNIAIALGFAVVCIIWVAFAKYVERAGKFRHGEEHGSSRWATTDEIKKFGDRKDYSNNILLTQNAKLRYIDKVHDRNLERNNNILIVGGSGSGKTLSYVVPNFLQQNANYVATDPKGTLVNIVGEDLEYGGYDVKVFSSIDFSKSCHYNPFAYITSETKILSIANNIITNTTGEKDKSNDPFWTNAEKLLYTALIGYLIYHCDPEDQNIPGLLYLLSLAEAKEDNEDYKSPLDILFYELETGKTYNLDDNEEAAKYDFGSRELEHEKVNKDGWQQVAKPLSPSDDFALSTYRQFKTAAGKTLKSIIISCNVRLKPFSIPQVQEILKDDDMELDKLGDADKKIAIIASVSDTDSTYDALFALLMWQSMDILCDKAINDYGGSLPRPVHFILDEFANIGKIADFERKIAVIRSRNISASIILQSISQLTDNYGEHGGETIRDCCDTELFLGGKSEKTTKQISEAAGKQTVANISVNDTRGNSYSTSHNFNVFERDLIQASEVARLSATEAIVLLSGTFPYKDKKYDFKTHPNFGLRERESASQADDRGSSDNKDEEIIASVRATADNYKAKQSLPKSTMYLSDEEINDNDEEYITKEMYEEDMFGEETEDVEILTKEEIENFAKECKEIFVSTGGETKKEMKFKDLKKKVKKAIEAFNEESEEQKEKDKQQAEKQETESKEQKEQRQEKEKLEAEKKKFEELINDEDWRVRVAVARKGFGLDKLVTDKEYWVRSAVAQQGYGLDQLIDDKDWQVRVAVARQGYGLDKLVKDPDPEVRAEVAYRGYNLDQLIRDETPYVRKAVARQGFGLETLLNDKESSVRREVARQGYGLERLADDENAEVANQAKKLLKEHAQQDIQEKKEEKQETESEEQKEQLEEDDDEEEKAKQKQREEELYRERLWREQVARQGYGFNKNNSVKRIGTEQLNTAIQEQNSSYQNHSQNQEKNE